MIVKDWPVARPRHDPAREARAELKSCRAREKKLRADLTLLEESFIPWVDEQDGLPPYERVTQRNIFLAHRAAINRHRLMLTATRRLIRELEEEVAAAEYP